MYKRLFWICVFVAGALTSTQFAIADYRITNGSTTETAWVVYSVWSPASGVWTEGWRTKGWYEIKPRETIDLPIHRDNTFVYIRVERENAEVKPVDYATRDRSLFWIHPSLAFTVVETNEGDFLRSDRGRWSLKRVDLYQYRNGGSHTIVDEPRLPDLPAQQIYNQAIHSVVWIHAAGYAGSGVLIDRTRRLIITNQHVTGTAEWVDVFFPWRNQDGHPNKNVDFYVRDWEWLETRAYATQGRVVAQNMRDDLAIVQLVQIPTTAREIQHDFSKDVEDTMRRGDTVHILGNPRNRLWNWTEGTFLTPQEICLPSDGACLVISGDTEEGNSGGPVLNGQGMLIGILTAGTDENIAAAAPAKNVKALLNTVPANVVTLPPQKQVFKIKNTTGVTVPYQIRWSNSNAWQSSSLETGFISTHWSRGQNIPSGYPKIRFDHIAGDQVVTYRTYELETARFREHNNNAPTYRFEYNRWGDRLDLVRDTLAAPSLSKAIPEETVLLTNYPNPFNPETWIPYQLAKPTEVTVTIYAADGKLVRTLALGHQPTGVYQSKSRAAYWDGRNEVGEPVASGVYFYTLKAGDFTATRKMLIQK